MKQFCYTAFLIILMICTHEGRGNTAKPLPWSFSRYNSNWHVLYSDTIPAKKPAEQKKEEPKSQEGETGKPVQPVNELPSKAESKTGEVIKTIKEVPKSKKQPKPVAVQAPQLPLRVPVIKTPKLIRKIKL